MHSIAQSWIASSTSVTKSHSACGTGEVAIASPTHAHSGSCSGSLMLPGQAVHFVLRVRDDYHFSAKRQCPIRNLCRAYEPYSKLGTYTCEADAGPCIVFVITRTSLHICCRPVSHELKQENFLSSYQTYTPCVHQVEVCGSIKLQLGIASTGNSRTCQHAQVMHSN
jgi:hypothetical protein